MFKIAEDRCNIRGTLVKQTDILLAQAWCIWKPEQIHAVATVDQHMLP